jgi:hypothetical protein
MEIVASIVDDLTKAKERAAGKVSARLTPILKDMATTANWPSDIVFQLEVKVEDMTIRVDYPEAIKSRVENLEYGDNSSPNAVLRPFLLRYEEQIGDILSQELSDTLYELGAYA